MTYVLSLIFASGFACRQTANIGFSKRSVFGFSPCRADTLHWWRWKREGTKHS